MITSSNSCSRYKAFHWKKKVMIWLDLTWTLMPISHLSRIKAITSKSTNVNHFIMYIDMQNEDTHHPKAVKYCLVRAHENGPNQQKSQAMGHWICPTGLHLYSRSERWKVIKLSWHCYTLNIYPPGDFLRPSLSFGTDRVNNMNPKYYYITLK